MRLILSIIAGIVIVLLLGSVLGIMIGIMLGLLIYCAIVLNQIHSKLTEDNPNSKLKEDAPKKDLTGRSVQEAVAKHMRDREARGIK